MQPGDTFGSLELLSLSVDRFPSGAKRETWTCRCLKCGAVCQYSGFALRDNKDRGCPDCRSSDQLKEREAAARAHIGEVCGTLTVIDFVGFVKVKATSPVGSPLMRCKCSSCGGVSDIPLARLLHNNVRTCAHCSRSKNLPLGREALDASSVGGTSAVCVLPDRKLNKNSTTGHRGVSFCKKSHKYRAYITFQRNQYYLGEYAKLEDAVAARKAGEEKIHGGFLAWYKEAYPDRWERLGLERRVQGDGDKRDDGGPDGQPPA